MLDSHKPGGLPSAFVYGSLPSCTLVQPWPAGYFPASGSDPERTQLRHRVPLPAVLSHCECRRRADDAGVASPSDAAAYRLRDRCRHPDQPVVTRMTRWKESQGLGDKSCGKTGGLRDHTPRFRSPGSESRRELAGGSSHSRMCQQTCRVIVHNRASSPGVSGAHPEFH